MGRCRKAGTISLSTMLIVTAAVPFVLVLMGASAPIVTAAWTNTGGGDHEGADWIITANVTIADNHYNIGLFRIASGVTVTVKSYDGTNYGWLEIHAENIVIEGTLSANSAGYRGSAANSGAPGEGPGGGGAASSGGGRGGGYFAGGASGGSAGGGGGYGGAGGSGGGGAAGGGSTAEFLSLRMGSGGSGAQRTSYNVAGGGSGGGKILLHAFGTVDVSGTLRASGGGGGSTRGGGSYAGGGGSGGGILIQGHNVDLSGNVHANGGGGGTASYSVAGGGGGGGSIDIIGVNLSGNVHANGGGGGSSHQSIAYGPGGGGGGGGKVRIVYENYLNISHSTSGGSGGTSAGGNGANGDNGTFETSQENMTAPSSPYCESATDPENVIDLTPEFSAVFRDPDPGDNGTFAHINVGTTAGGSDMWDSGWVDITNVSVGSRSQEISYGGSPLSRGVIYYWRIRFKDTHGLIGVWSENQQFMLSTPLRIISITASPTLVDRKVNQPVSGAIDTTRIYITTQDNFGRDWIENAFFWIRDNIDNVVVDNLQLTNYENIDENTKRFFFDFNPDNLTSCGKFDIKAQMVSVDGFENTKDYTSLGYELFEVNDLTVTLSVVDNTPLYQLATSGTIARISGTVSADNIVLQDNNQGAIITTFGDNGFNKTYGLVSPVRLHRGDLGQFYAWARDNTLDGISPTLTYQVEGDNATLSITTVNNQVGQSVVGISATWASDSTNVGSDTAYFETESPEAVISNGTGQFTLDHSTWITSGARVISLYDNADRPLWNVTVKPTLITKSLVWTENQALSGSQDNASLTIKITYNDGSTNPTIKAELLAGTMDNGQVTADENGLLTWSGINLLDNTQDIQIKLDNVYDSRTDWVINANSVEDVTLYTENTTCGFTIADNTLDVYYGSSETFEGTVTSEANYVSLEVRANIHYDNGDLIENKSTTLSPGVSDSWSFTLSPSKTTLYKLEMLSPSGTLMWEQGASITVSFRTPSLVSPADASATNDNTPTLSWTSVSGAEGYTLQYSAVENFDIHTENTTTENQYTLLELAENRYYWQVKATTTADNIKNSNWSGVRSFWVDRTGSVLSNFVINNGNTETTSTSVTLTLSASDTGSGVYQMCFKNEGGSWSSWEAYSTSKAWTLSSGDGLKTVYAKVRDRALNESSISSDGITKTAYVPPSGGGTPPPPADTTPPTLTVLEPTTTEVGENVMVRVNASDPSSIDSSSIQVKLDEGAVEHIWADGVVACSFVGLSAGEHLVVMRVSDASSNHNQTTANISFTVVAPVENVKNVENVENVTPTPTFTFQLLETPPEVENGYTQIILWITNPTPQPILKHCELRFNNHVKSFDIEVAAGENALVTMWIDVAGLNGTYDVELYDADTNTVLDEGEITLLAAAKQLEVPQVAVTSPPPSPLIVAIGVVGVAVGLGVLRIARRLPKIKMPKFGLKLPKVKITRPSMPSIRLPSLPRLPKIKHKPKLEKRPVPEEGWLKRILERAREKELEREEELEFAEESPVVQDIYHLLEPAARELATGKKVGHLGRAVKPYKKRRR